MSDARAARRKRLAQYKHPSFIADLCLICGKSFRNSDCPHSFSENDALLTAFRHEEIVRNYL